MKNVNNSITDLRIMLCLGEKEVVVYDNDRFDEVTAGVYDGKAIITLKMTDYMEEYLDERAPVLKLRFHLKIFAETIPERKDNYDRIGNLEFVDMIAY